MDDERDEEDRRRRITRRTKKEGLDEVVIRVKRTKRYIGRKVKKRFGNLSVFAGIVK